MNMALICSHDLFQYEEEGEEADDEVRLLQMEACVPSLETPA